MAHRSRLSARKERGEQEEQHCVVCGCTQMNACPDGCSWVEPGLCSNPVCVMFARMYTSLCELLKMGPTRTILGKVSTTVKTVKRHVERRAA